jgi:hypothetical protein
MIHTQQLIDSQAVNDMTTRHSDAVRVDQYTRAVPKLTAYEQACSAFESTPHEIKPDASGVLAGGKWERHGKTVTISGTIHVGADLPPDIRPTLWNTGTPAIAGIYEACACGPTEGYIAWFDGNTWHADTKVGGHEDDHKEARSRISAGPDCVYYRRLIEADKPPVAEKGVWIEWKGGEQPLPDHVQVEVEFRDAEILSDVAGSWFWAHEQNEGDIVRYRIL